MCGRGLTRDLSNYGIPSSPVISVSKSTSLPEFEPTSLHGEEAGFASSAPSDTQSSSLLDLFEDTKAEESDEDAIPKGTVLPGVVRHSRLPQLNGGIGFRSIPPFRRRVVFLPALPIVTSQSVRDQPVERKQVRFFTNVICHEYTSY